MPLGICLQKITAAAHKGTKECHRTDYNGSLREKLCVAAIKKQGHLIFENLMQERKPGGGPLRETGSKLCHRSIEGRFFGITF